MSTRWPAERCWSGCAAWARISRSWCNPRWRSSRSPCWPPPQVPGAATNLFSAVADEWRASPDLVALTTGALSGLCGLVGAVIGGWVADRFGRFWGYFGFSVLLAMVTTGMAIAPHSPTAYGTGVLAYNLALGMMNAAWSAVVLFAIGRGAASTKYALLSSLGNLPVSYMTAIDGWAHDKWGANGMLNTESVLGVLSVVLALPVLWWVTARRRN